MVTPDPFQPIARPSAVLFACNLNSIRSPMAEALLKRHLGTRIYVDSCGIRIGAEVDGFMIAVMAEIGIDLTAHHPKTFDELDDAYYDLIISLSPEAQHRATEMTRAMACEIEYWPTMDATLSRGRPGGSVGRVPPSSRSLGGADRGAFWPLAPRRRLIHRGWREKG